MSVVTLLCDDLVETGSVLFSSSTRLLSLSTQTMDTVHDDNDLVFLYKLIRGQTSSSYACKVAAAMGIEQSIVERGSEVTELISRNQPVTRKDSPAMEQQHKMLV